MNVWDSPWDTPALSPAPSPAPASPFPSSRATSPHPLNSLSATRITVNPLGSTSSLSQPQATSTSSLIRSRKQSVNPVPQSHDPDPDVTRPRLKQLTAKELAHVKPPTKSRTSLDDQQAPAARGSPSIGVGGEEEQTEVVVHQLLKTDTIASISLQYGITPQALRQANRLWANDTIHLRSVLNIPLDKCDLPSSSTIQGISRDEDGGLVVWERERERETAGSQKGILSPYARRATSEMGALGSSASGSCADLLGLETVSARSSMDDFREEPNGIGKGKGKSLMTNLIDADDVVSTYLSSTNNPYSFSAPPSPPLVSLRASPVDLYRRDTPPIPHTSTHTSPLIPTTTSPPELPDDNDYYSRPASSTSASSTHSNSLAPPSTSTSTVRKLNVSRVPISALSFFPAPAPSFSSNPASARSSFSDLDRLPPPDSFNHSSRSASSTDLGFSNPTAPVNRNRNVARTMADIGPLSNSLSKSHLAVPTPSPPPKPPSASSTTKLKTKPSWYERWDISYFGAEG
ncbi:hypothetical protein P7C70_g8642, partial [Phenoliferia sp. Uapishka_3]